MIPGWLVLAVLALASYRLTRLAGWDDFPPIVKVRNWVTGGKIERGGSSNARMRLTNEAPEVVYRYRWPLLAHALACPYCAGLWWCTAVYGVWVAAGAPGHAHPHSWLFYVLMPFALNGIVGTWARILDP